MQPLKFISLLFWRLWIIAIGKKERDKLDRAQRRAAKIVLETKDSDTEKNLRWLPLSMRRDMHTLLIWLLNAWRDPLQCFLKIILRFLEQSTTRGSGHNLLLPKVRTETARKSFYFNGSKLFSNMIASEVKDSRSVVIFKARILELYIDQKFFSQLFYVFVLV